MAWQHRSWVILPAMAAASCRAALRSPCSLTSSTEAAAAPHAAVMGGQARPCVRGGSTHAGSSGRQLCSSFLLRAEPPPL